MLCYRITWPHMQRTTKGCPHILTENYGRNILYLKLLGAQKSPFWGDISIQVANGNLVYHNSG